MKRLIIILILIACFVASAEEAKSYTAEKQGSSMWFKLTITTDEVKDQFDHDFSEFSIRKSKYLKMTKPNKFDYCHCKIICNREFKTEQSKTKTTGGTIMTEAMKHTLLFYTTGGLTSKDGKIGYAPAATTTIRMFISCKTEYREVTKLQIIRKNNTITIYEDGSYEVEDNSND